MAYALPFPYFEALNNPNEHVRLYMTMALVEDGTAAIDGPTERYGWVNDRALRDGRLYAGKAPGASLLGVPVYALASWLVEARGETLGRRAAVRLLRQIAVTLPCLLFLLAFRRFLDDFEASAWARDLIFVTYALGSMALAYGLMFAGHQLAAVCAVGGLVALHAAARRLELGRPRAPALAALGGLLLGAAPAMEYPAALAVAVIGLYGVLVLRRSPRALAAMLAAGALPLAGLLVFHRVVFGSPFAFPYDFIETPAFQRLLAEGWHGMTTPRWDRLSAILWAPSFGIFFFTPLLLLAPVGWVALARRWRDLPPSRRHLAWTLPAGATVLILYLASSALWRGGWAVGPRYIASAVALLAIAALPGVETLARRWPRAGPVIAGVGALLSLWHAGVAGMLYPHQPEAFDNPVYDLDARLIALGFAPHTALEPLGVVGHGALAVLGLIMIGAIAPALAAPRRGWRRRLLTVSGATLTAFAISLAVAQLGENDEAEERMWALVVRTWEPAGHSIPERRLAAFEALSSPTVAQLQAAAREARRLGRESEARRLDRRAERLQRRERRERDELPSQQMLLPSLSENPAWGAGD